MRLFAVLFTQAYLTVPRPLDSGIHFLPYTGEMSRDDLIQEHLKLVRGIFGEEYVYSEKRYYRDVEGAWVVDEATKEHIEAADTESLGAGWGDSEGDAVLEVLTSICKNMANITLNLPDMDLA